MTNLRKSPCKWPNRWMKLCQRLLWCYHSVCSIRRQRSDPWKREKRARIHMSTFRYKENERTQTVRTEHRVQYTTVLKCCVYQANLTCRRCPCDRALDHKWWLKERTPFRASSRIRHCSGRQPAASAHYTRYHMLGFQQLSAAQKRVPQKLQDRHLIFSTTRSWSCLRLQVTMQIINILHLAPRVLKLTT